MKIKKLLIWTAVAIALLLGALYGVYSIYVGEEYRGDETRIYIPAGSDSAAVRDTLDAALGRFGAKVYYLWDLNGAKTAAAHGSYVVSPGQNALEVARRLSTGRQTPMRFTFNNLRTFGELSAMLGARLEADSAAFAGCADTLFLAQGFAPAEFAAAVMPDTYEYYWTSAPERVFGSMTRAREAFWDSTRVAKAAALGLTPAQVATVASIVEEETAKADERPQVARLYLNRLERNMLLQADPTVKFALGDFSLRRITAEHLAVQSPYNTYVNPGLPPGPIRIVERASIDAVLDAPAHDYLYMCAKPDFSGYHDFAVNYDRHRINAARYHRALSRRGL